MITLIGAESLGSQTSAIGSMVRAGALGIILFGIGPTGSATANTYGGYLPPDRTMAGPLGALITIPSTVAETTAEAILEVRRRSGLTWEELAELFDVSRRSVHHWASGKAVSARHDHLIRRTLVALRQIDRGEAARTRDLLLKPSTGGTLLIDLLKAEQFEEAVARTGGSSTPGSTSSARLAPEEQRRRQPPSPTALVGALQDRPIASGRAMPTRFVRPPKVEG